MAPAILLVVVYTGLQTLRANGMLRRTSGELGAWALASMYLLTGINHFVNEAELVAMLPDWVPRRTLWVQCSGLFELSIAAALCSDGLRRFAARVSFVFLLLVFPVNVWAAIEHVGVGMHKFGPTYLWVRAPIQLLFVIWSAWVAREPGCTKSRSKSEDLVNVGPGMQR